jgi:hypothetical protein
MRCRSQTPCINLQTGQFLANSCSGIKSLLADDVAARQLSSSRTVEPAELRSSEWNPAVL